MHLRHGPKTAGERNTLPMQSDYVLKENTTMYALWDETVTPITYYIEFDGNAGQRQETYLAEWKHSTGKK